MWRVSILAGVLIAVFATVVAASLSSMRPAPRPQLMPDGRPVVRPQPRPDQAVALPELIRPPARPMRAKVMTAAVVRPMARPAVQSVPVVLQGPVRANPEPRPAAAVPAARSVDVVMIGDSITAGGKWRANFPNRRIANRGVPSDTALRILERMDGILATKPKRALLMFGINDIYNGVPVARIMQRYDRVVSLLLTRDIEVVIQSTLACSGAVCGDKLDDVARLNAELQKLAETRGLVFVDINRALSDRGGLKTVYSRDGIHLNSAGYAQWYKVLAQHVARS